MVNLSSLRTQKEANGLRKMEYSFKDNSIIRSQFDTDDDTRIIFTTQNTNDEKTDNNSKNAKKIKNSAVLYC